ncbi:MAG: hypothetical protein ACSLE1_18110 [Sphingobium sp.]
MPINELTSAALDAASDAIGDGPVAMVNFLWFRRSPRYADSFEDRKTTARDAYYEGYAGAIRAVAADLGVAMNLIYAGDRLHGLLAKPHEDWDDIVIVRYDSFSGLRRIVESDAYHSTAKPHRVAAVKDWRFFATKSK